MESPPSFVARHGGKVTNYYAIRESEAAAGENRPLTESTRTAGAARQLVVDCHLGSVDVDVFPLRTASDDARELFLHMARPIG